MTECPVDENYLRRESASSVTLTFSGPTGLMVPELLLLVCGISLMMSLPLQSLLRHSLHLRTHPK